MHKLLDRISYITEEMKGMQRGFADSEKYSLDTLRETTQDILKKTYETEKSHVLGSIKQMEARIVMIIPKLIIPDNIIADNLYQRVIQDQNERNLQENHLDFEFHRLSEKIRHMNTQEIFEFLDTFSKKNLYDTIMPELRRVRQIPVIVKQIPVIVEPVPKIDAGKTSPERIEVKPTPVKIKPR